MSACSAREPDHALPAPADQRGNSALHRLRHNLMTLEPVAITVMADLFPGERTADNPDRFNHMETNDPTSSLRPSISSARWAPTRSSPKTPSPTG